MQKNSVLKHSIQGRLQVKRITQAHYVIYTDWIPPFKTCLTEISICSYFGWPYHCSVMLVTQQWMSSSLNKCYATSNKFSWELLVDCCVTNITEQW